MRKETWPTDLAAFIESRMNTPFSWGVHDCTLFAADSALAMTGIDPAADFRGTYNSQIGAARIIVEYGSFRNLVNTYMDGEINPKLAQRGDWVLVEQDGAEALAVCAGVNMVAAGLAGLVFRPMSDAITAWRIN